MSEPTWLKTISNHAVISRAELLEWLGVTGHQLKALVKHQGFPQPRINNFKANGVVHDRLTPASRWRVGDVRAWLEGSPRLVKELSTPVGSESSQSIKTLRERGYDGMARYVGKH